jgi:hypothetical protein
MLSADEAEAMAEFHNEVAQPLDQPVLDLAFLATSTTRPVA